MLNRIYSVLQKQTLLWLILVLAATFVVFKPTLSHDFVNWDDDELILNNLSIQTLDWDHVQRIFSRLEIETYVPLTALSFAVEYHFFGENPFIYHLTNLLLHLGVTALVFFLALRMGLKAPAAGLSALIFGIHPMHVESVAWITERKDVLYSLFYLAGLHFYWGYAGTFRMELFSTGRKRWSLFLGAIIFFGFSILSKPMALSFPLILILLDRFAQRKWSLRLFLEKIPFLAIAVSVGWITYSMHARTPQMNWVEGPLIWIWCLTFYLKTFFLPINLIPIYNLPQPVHVQNPEYLLAVGILLFSLIILWVGKKSRWLTLAAGFFFLSTFFLFRFDDVADINIVADRFMYLPSFGFCLLAGYLWQKRAMSRMNPLSLRIVVGICVVGILVILGLGTHQQVQTWKNSISLWRHQLSIDPDEAIALSNLVVALQDLPEYQEAKQLYAEVRELDADSEDLLDPQVKESIKLVEELKDMLRKAIAADPEYRKAYFNLGRLHQDLKEYDMALVQYRAALVLKGNYKDPLINVGHIYRKLGEHQKAIVIYETLLKQNPGVKDVYYYVIQAYKEEIQKNTSSTVIYQTALKRALAAYAAITQGREASAEYYFELGDFYLEADDLARAKLAYETALGIDPNHVFALYHMGDIYERLGLPGRAESIYRHVLSIDDSFDKAYLALGVLKHQAGFPLEARKLYRRVLELNPKNANAYFNLGFMEESVQQFEEALSNYAKAVKLDPEHAEAHYNMGNVYAQTGRSEKAIESYLRTVELDPRHLDAYVNLSILYYREGNVAEAARYCDEAIFLGYEPPAEYVEALSSGR